MGCRLLGNQTLKVDFDGAPYSLYISGNSSGGMSLS